MLGTEGELIPQEHAGILNSDPDTPHKDKMLNL